MNINLLCNIAKVSVSGYYKYRKNKLNNNLKEDKEKQDLELIKTLVLKYNRKYGYRRILMELRNKYNKRINHKKILRLMKKYGLLAKIRRKNPYAQIQKATQEHRTCPNILNRKFRGLNAFLKYGTDISYLHFNGKRAYISILKDMITGEIVSFKLSTNLGIGFVIETIKQASNKVNLNGSIIHSDQGFHYTNPAYQKLLKDLGVIQSMSRKGNCLDNAPTESFFGHMKDEIDLKSVKNFKELEILIKNYIFYYNNERYQWNRKKMTPVQYRNHLLEK